MQTVLYCGKRALHRILLAAESMTEGGRFSYPTFLLSNITDALNCQLLPVEAWPRRLLAMMMACLDSRAT